LLLLLCCVLLIRCFFSTIFLFFGYWHGGCQLLQLYLANSSGFVHQFIVVSKDSMLNGKYLEYSVFVVVSVRPKSIQFSSVQYNSVPFSSVHISSVQYDSVRFSFSSLAFSSGIQSGIQFGHFVRLKTDNSNPNDWKSKLNRFCLNFQGTIS
jgi:hypothetical protein